MTLKLSPDMIADPPMKILCHACIVVNRQSGLASPQDTGFGNQRRAQPSTCQRDFRRIAREVSHTKTTVLGSGKAVVLHCPAMA